MRSIVRELIHPRGRARRHLAVRVGIAMWLTLGLAFRLCFGLAHGDPVVLLSCSVVCFAMAAVSAVLPDGRRLSFLLHAGAALSIVLVAVSVAASGGVASPLMAASVICVAYCAGFLLPRVAVGLIGAMVAADLLPLLYDSATVSHVLLARTLILTAGLAAGGIGLVLVRSRLAEVVVIGNERLKTIVALHREVEQAEFDVFEVVLGILDRARTLLGATAASAGILEGDDIVYKYRTGPGRDSGVEIRTPANASLSGICLRTGEPAYCEDSEIDPRVDKAACRKQALRSMIIAPLRHRGKVVGVLNVNSPRRRAFSRNDVGTVQLIAGAISAAYGHAVDVEAKQRLLNELEGTVAELRTTERKLSHQATHDPLTGLPNRAFFLERLEQALEGDGEARTAVLFIDLDGFKLINDSLGHATGDAVLIKAAERIKGALRAEDTAARLGGDEFAIICGAPSPVSAARRVAERLLSSLAGAFRLDGRDVLLTASIGIAAERGSAENFLRDADVAMYYAKTMGKCRYAVYTPETHAEVSTRLELEADLQEALAKQQFVLHYQPIVALAGARTAGVEALIRWQHPTRGMLPPGLLVPMLEESAQIKGIGAWVLREACRQLAAWQAEGLASPDYYVSVNLSALQLADASIVFEVSDALEAAGLAPQNLVLELTETAIMRDIELTVERLRALKRLGVRIAIDDFGTAYSSLQYLQQLPIDVLKIAKPFIDRLAKGDEEAVIPRAITDLGHRLRLDMVAEGIEYPEQLDRLLELGCPHGQGFLFSKPVPPDQVAPAPVSPAELASPRIALAAGE
jgi:diguanylate cyclase (GGDEF)-like protein